MAFDGGEQKQRLNLSALASEVVRYDQFTFGVKSISGFLNQIFENYAPIAAASISCRLRELQGELEETLSATIWDKRTKAMLIKRLVGKREAELRNQAGLYKKGESLLFNLNKQNFSYLTEPESECGEQNYYARRGEYIKCVIEEYARLPHIQRERIYFSSFIEEIEKAIHVERQLRIVTDRNKVYSIYAYKILPDPLFTANYLVGYSRRYHCPEEEKRPLTLRISALQSVKLEKSKSAFLKKSEQKQLDRLTVSRGVQFMSGDEEKIWVRLSEQGKFKYRRQIHLRPTLIEKSGEDVFVFQCTQAQAEFYFFKFGEDAEIIRPERLRTKMATMYDRATEMYRRDSQRNLEE